MCGIIGLIKSKNLKVVDPKQMLDSLRHRGPDEQDSYEDERVLLGHTRLSIVGIGDGQQPFSYGKYTIVFNGEIYNHNSLRSELSEIGYNFETNSDTEVLLKCFDAYGKDCIEYLNGMYAFVIYDREKDELFLSRDYFGIKPLYIYQNNDQLFFASEVVALLNLMKLADIKFDINSKALKEYLDSDCISNQALVDGIFELEKGGIYRFNENSITLLQKAKYQHDIGDKSIEKLLLEELEQELDADVEVGVLLSGGIDSSLLTALSSKLRDKVSTFSVAFENKSLYDESKYANEVSKKYGTNHKEFLFSEKELLEYIPVLLNTVDMPFYDPAMLPMLYLCNNVSNTCKVVLSGDGGDELFGGYQHHKIAKYYAFFNLLEILLRPLSKVPFIGNKHRVLRNLLKSGNSFDQSIEFDRTVGLNNRLLRKTDLCSMRFGVEVRVPFLSKRLYSYARKKGGKSFVNIIFGKFPLRMMVWRKIGYKIAFKKKQGFRVPIREWIVNGELGKHVQEELMENLIISNEVISRNEISHYLKNKGVFYKELFSLFLLNGWLKKINNERFTN